VGVLEITVEEEEGIRAIAELGGSGLLIGAGTITGLGQAAAAVEAGAGFLVSPHHDPSLLRWAVESGVTFIPGAFTPTEIHSAWASGAPAVKVFPASVGGPDLVSAVKGPLPQVSLIPTGGVTATNAGDYLAAGAVAVGVGGWLTGLDDLEMVTERAAQLAEAVRPA
jgi:2-dehydro-3-deoxyphosphogluconate aldolase/(4S)-4-hydroxy-2-oxoglutarate aldolase